MSKFQTIATEARDHTLILTLNRPDIRNAMSARMYAECTDALEAADGDSNVRCVILTGAGTCFSAGRDLKEQNASRRAGYEYLEHTLFSPAGPGRFYSFLTQYRKPIITAINGPAVAGGCIVALLGDISVASDKAFFACSEIDRGFLAPGGLMIFPKLISRAQGAYLLMTGDRISAQEAMKIGMITRVVPARQLMSQALAIAKKVGEKGPTAMRLLKTAMLTGPWGDDLRTNIAQQAMRAIADGTSDRIEGISAYVNKKRDRRKKA